MSSAPSYIDWKVPVAVATTTNIAGVFTGLDFGPGDTFAGIPGGVVSISGFTQPTGGTLTAGTYTDVSLTGGSGSGAEATIVVSGSGGPPVINLNSSVTYGVLANSTITASNASIVNGDLGLYPGTSVTGTITVSGATNIDNGAASTALNDASNAFIAGNSLSFTTIAAELGGTSPAPGYYTTGSSFQITGTVTLNGSATDVWVFQSPSSTLTTAASSVVLLTGGALPQNVYWLIGSSATLGTSSVFNGTIIAQASITDDGGSTVTGHMLALTAAVTLNNTTVTATPAGSGSGSTTVTSVTLTTAGSGYTTGNVLGYTGVGLGTGGTATVGVVASNTLTIDTYTPVTGDRILIKNQTLTYQNGIYQAYVNPVSGQVSTLTLTSGGTGYTDGQYYNLATTTSGSGVGAEVDVTVVDGIVTAIAISDIYADVPNQGGPAAGSGYAVADTIVPVGIGAGSGLSVTVATLSPAWVLTRTVDANTSEQFPGMACFVNSGSQVGTAWVQTNVPVTLSVTSQISSAGSIVQPSATTYFPIVNGTYTNVPLAGGNGTNAAATVTVAGGVVTTVNVPTPGTGYQNGDVLNFASYQGVGVSGNSYWGLGTGGSVVVTTTTPASSAVTFVELVAA